MLPVKPALKENCKKLTKLLKGYSTTTFKDGLQANIHSLAWNYDGTRLASGGNDKNVCSFILNDNNELIREHTFRGHSHQVDQVCWHRSSADLIASASGDKTVRVWDVRSRKCVATVDTKGENIYLDWSPDGSTIAVGNKEDLISFIETRTFTVVTTEQFSIETNQFRWNNTNSLFFICNGNGQIIVLSWPNLERLSVIQAHPSTILCIEFDLSGEYFAIGGLDALISLWDAKNLICLRTFERHACFLILDWPVQTISFSHDSALLASGSEDLFVDIAHVETGGSVAELPCEYPTFTLAWHPKVHLLAYAGDEKARTFYERDRVDRETGSIGLFGVGLNKV
ncbi:THO complex subunit 3 [Trichinella pseudospiralis]|uniref:THO complex subunit 3 n=2 Tax=Trichinella pseudospiralis TaxID=6337 RepID=A0A0V0YN75_TRIPS|nr:THO complex subunit 3 [Trichinella pseudospiralis]KRZ29286.1 THO complex subunit 3 [Trichinella pseudospiralis]